MEFIEVIDNLNYPPFCFNYVGVPLLIECFTLFTRCRLLLCLICIQLLFYQNVILSSLVRAPEKYQKHENMEDIRKIII